MISLFRSISLLVLFAVITLTSFGQEREPVTTEIELQPVSENMDAADQMKIQFSFTALEKDDYEILFNVKTFKSGVMKDKKIYPAYIVNAATLVKDFNKTLILGNFILRFRLDKKHYFNSKDVVKKAGEALDAALEEVQHEINLQKSDTQLEGLKNIPEKAEEKPERKKVIRSPAKSMDKE